MTEVDIDKLFESSLDSLKAKPSAGAWDNISHGLDITPSAASNFDQQIENSLSDLKGKPSSKVWSNIDAHLESAAAAATAANLSFDSQVEETLDNVQYNTSSNLWTSISNKLDGIEAANEYLSKQIMQLFVITASIAAMLIFITYRYMPGLKNNANNFPFTTTNTINSTKYQALISTSEIKTPIESTKKVTKTNLTQTATQQTVVEIEPNTTEAKQTTTHAISAKGNNKKYITGNAKSINTKTETSSRLSETEEITSNKQEQNNSTNSDFTSAVAEVKRMKLKNPNNNSRLSNSDMGGKLASPSHFIQLRAATGFSIDVFGGPEIIANKTMKDASFNKSLVLEKVSPYCIDYSFGLNLKFHYNQFFIQSGMAYSNFGEQRTFQLNNELHDTSGGYFSYNINTYYTYDTVAWVDDPLQPGVLVPQLSSVMHTDTTVGAWNSQDSLYFNINKNKSNNRFRYIEIPIMLGYQTEYKKWGFQFAAGISYGFKVAEQGKYIDRGRLNNIYQSSSPYSDFTTNGIASIGLSYALTNRLSILFQPTYKTNLKDLSKLSVSYQSLSLRLGVNVKL